MSALTPDETILGLLAHQPQHGYQLLEAFHDPDRLAGAWKMSASQMYAVLKRLEAGGLISGASVASPVAPTRTEYAITAAGRAALHGWLEAPDPSPSIRYVRVQFISRLYIAGLLGWPVMPIIDRQRAACRAERDLRLADAAALDTGIGWLAADIAIAQLDAVLAWIDRCEITLQPT
jgi:DNA-binding PadR family transcriptional regulator